MLDFKSNGVALDDAYVTWDEIAGGGYHSLALKL